MVLDDAVIEAIRLDLRRSANSVVIGRNIEFLSSEFGSAAEFIHWCGEHLGISQSQVYKYKRLYRVFGAYENKFDFAEIPMRLLYEVTENSDVLKDFIDAIIAKSSVDAEWLKSALEIGPKTIPENKYEDIDFLVNEVIRVGEDNTRLANENKELRTIISSILELCKSKV
jgi:hypothetical protein